eukprot:jgi/Bigna1/73640/fgenesh1_pg.25_\
MLPPPIGRGRGLLSLCILLMAGGVPAANSGSSVTMPMHRVQSTSASSIAGSPNAHLSEEMLRQAGWEKVEIGKLKGGVIKKTDAAVRFAETKKSVGGQARAPGLVSPTVGLSYKTKAKVKQRTSNLSFPLHTASTLCNREGHQPNQEIVENVSQSSSKWHVPSIAGGSSSAASHSSSVNEILPPSTSMGYRRTSRVTSTVTEDNAHGQTRHVVPAISMQEGLPTTTIHPVLHGGELAEEGVKVNGYTQVKSPHLRSSLSNDASHSHHRARVQYNAAAATSTSTKRTPGLSDSSGRGFTTAATTAAASLATATPTTPDTSSTVHYTSTPSIVQEAAAGSMQAPSSVSYNGRSSELLPSHAGAPVGQMGADSRRQISISIPAGPAQVVDIEHIALGGMPAGQQHKSGMLDSSLHLHNQHSSEGSRSSLTPSSLRYWRNEEPALARMGMMGGGGGGGYYHGEKGGWGDVTRWNDFHHQAHRQLESMRSKRIPIQMAELQGLKAKIQSKIEATKQELDHLRALVLVCSLLVFTFLGQLRGVKKPQGSLEKIVEAKVKEALQEEEEEKEEKEERTGVEEKRKEATENETKANREEGRLPSSPSPVPSNSSSNEQQHHRYNEALAKRTSSVEKELEAVRDFVKGQLAFNKNLMATLEDLRKRVKEE